MPPANIGAVMTDPQVYTVRISVAGLSDKDVFPVTHAAIRIAVQPNSIRGLGVIRVMWLYLDEGNTVGLQGICKILRARKWFVQHVFPARSWGAKASLSYGLSPHDGGLVGTATFPTYP